MLAEIFPQPVRKMLGLVGFFHADLGTGAMRGGRFSGCWCAGIHVGAGILLEPGIPFSHGS